MQEKRVPVKALKPLRYNGEDYSPGRDLEIEESRVPEWTRLGLVAAKQPELFPKGGKEEEEEEEKEEEDPGMEGKKEGEKKPETATKQPGETADRPRTRDGKGK